MSDEPYWCKECNEMHGCNESCPSHAQSKLLPTLRTLIAELDRPDLDDAAKAVIQAEIERFLGRNAREVLESLEAHVANPTRPPPHRPAN